MRTIQHPGTFGQAAILVTDASQQLIDLSMDPFGISSAWELMLPRQWLPGHLRKRGLGRARHWRVCIHVGSTLTDLAGVCVERNGPA